MDYDDYSKVCDETRAKNNEYPDFFEQALAASVPRDITIKGHLPDAEFFMHKRLWSVPGIIKSTAADIKKFYKRMARHGIVKKERRRTANFCVPEPGMGWKSGGQTVPSVMSLMSRARLVFSFDGGLP